MNQRILTALYDLGAAFGKPGSTVERIATQWAPDLEAFPEGLVCQVLDEVRRSETHWPSLALVLAKLQGSRGPTQKPPGCPECDHTGTRTVYWHTTAGGVPTSWAARCLCAAGNHYRRSFPTVAHLRANLGARNGHLATYVSGAEPMPRWQRLGKDHPICTQEER